MRKIALIMETIAGKKLKAIKWKKKNLKKLKKRKVPIFERVRELLMVVKSSLTAPKPTTKVKLYVLMINLMHIL